MNHNKESAGKLLDIFLSRSATKKTVLTLGGTGPNGTCQLAIVDLLGFEFSQNIDVINLLSGSVFGYFIYLAFFENKIKTHNYLNYDCGVRKLHKASLMRAIKYFFTLNKKNKSLYECERVKETVFYLFDPEYANRELQSFNNNMVFWGYCSKREELIKITADTFPTMKVWEVIAASLSIPFIHGEFEYEKYLFSDPMFCPKYKILIKSILKNSENHLFVNYKKNQLSRNVIFLKNQNIRFPTLCLIYDFFSFTCNFKNNRLIKTHKDNTLILGGKNTQNS